MATFREKSIMFEMFIILLIFVSSVLVPVHCNCGFVTQQFSKQNVTLTFHLQGNKTSFQVNHGKSIVYIEGAQKKNNSLNNSKHYEVIKRPNQKFSFKIVNVNKNDAGIYNLTKMGTGGSLECIQLAITDKPVTIISKQSQPVLRGKYRKGNIALTCYATSTTTPVDHNLPTIYRWFKNDIYYGNGSILQDTDVDITDKGSNITCIATDDPECNKSLQNLKQDATLTTVVKDERCEDVLGISNKFILRPEYGPYDTTLTYGSTTLKPSDKIQKRIGEELSVNCMSDCNPACNISWYKDGKMLSYNSQLNLQDLQESDDGVYTCTIYNIHATTNISFTLDLKYGPYDTTLTYGSTTLKPSDKIQKRIGEELSVNCMSDCNPACNISWYKDGKMLSYNSQLNLQDLQESDDGVYTCTVYNIHATTNISFTLDLKYGPYDTTLTYGNTTLKPSDEIQKRIGEELSVNCMSDCNPACNISWYKDGKMLSYNSQLNLPHLQESDDGVYTCTVYNIHGNRDISFRLSIKTPTEDNKHQPANEGNQPFIIILGLSIGVVLLVIIVSVLIVVFICMKIRNVPGGYTKSKKRRKKKKSSPQKVYPGWRTNENRRDDDERLFEAIELHRGAALADTKRNFANFKLREAHNNIEELIYADLDLPLSNNNIIHGQKYKIIYGVIDFNKVPPPRPCGYVSEEDSSSSSSS